MSFKTRLKSLEKANRQSMLAELLPLVHDDAELVELTTRLPNDDLRKLCNLRGWMQEGTTNGVIQQIPELDELPESREEYLKKCEAYSNRMETGE